MILAVTFPQDTTVLLWWAEEWHTRSHKESVVNSISLFLSYSLKRNLQWEARPYLWHTAGTSQRGCVQQFLQSRWAFSEFAAQLPVAPQTFRLLLDVAYFPLHPAVSLKKNAQMWARWVSPEGLKDDCQRQTPTNYRLKSVGAGRLLCCIQRLQGRWELAKLRNKRVSLHGPVYITLYSFQLRQENKVICNHEKKTFAQWGNEKWQG